MKTAFVALFAMCSTLFAAVDPISRLADILNENRLWTSEGFSAINLPRDATPLQVAKELFTQTKDYKGKIEDFEVEQTKKVTIHNDNYTATWFGTNQGGRIILMRYVSPQVGWQAGSFDAKYLFQPQ